MAEAQCNAMLIKHFKVLPSIQKFKLYRLSTALLATTDDDDDDSVKVFIVSPPVDVVYVVVAVDFPSSSITQGPDADDGRLRLPLPVAMGVVRWVSELITMEVLITAET